MVPVPGSRAGNRDHAAAQNPRRHPIPNPAAHPAQARQPGPGPRQPPDRPGRRNHKGFWGRRSHFVRSWRARGPRAPTGPEPDRAPRRTGAHRRRATGSAATAGPPHKHRVAPTVPSLSDPPRANTQGRAPLAPPGPETGTRTAPTCRRRIVSVTTPPPDSDRPGTPPGGGSAPRRTKTARALYQKGLFTRR
jgi:hypothetical protein